MSKFKARLKVPEYVSPEGIYLHNKTEYQCYVKQSPLNMPTEDIPTFIELCPEPAKKIGMLLEEFLEHFILFGQCEYCGKWFETTYPSALCPDCIGRMEQAYARAITIGIDEPSNYKRLKDRFKED